MDLLTHGVIRLNGGGTCNGKSTDIAYIMPPAVVTIEPEDSLLEERAVLESCTVNELKNILSFLDISSTARTKSGLIAAIRLHVESLCTVL